MKKVLISLLATVFCTLVYSQTVGLVDKFDSQTHFHSLYDKGEMRYSFDKNKPLNFNEWQTLFRMELKNKLGITKIEKQLNGYKPVAVKKDSEDVGFAIRERWEIWTEPTVPLPFIILRPKNQKGDVPLVITPHGHSKNTESYAGVYENEEDRKSGEEGERNIAVQAVEQGYIAIAPTARGFGKTRTPEGIEKDENNSCRIQLMHDLLVGRTPIGDRVWDVMKLIDWAVENLPIDASKIIVTGNSGGGTTTLFAGAVDTRIAMSLPGSYFNTFENSIGTLNHCDCNYIPGILDLGNMCDIAGLTAPRHFCAIHGEKDPIYPVVETRKAFAQLQKIYAAAGVPENCDLYVGSEGHRYYKTGAWNFINKNLNNVTPVKKLYERIGVCTSPGNGAVVKAAGGDYTELGINGYLIPEKSDAEFAENLQTALSSPLPIPSGNGFFPGDIKLVGPNAEKERALHFAEKAMQRAAKLGTKVFVLGSGKAREIPEGFNRDEANAQFTDLCKELALIAEKYDVTIVIEPLNRTETNYINSVREGMKIVRAVNHPNLCVLADFYHMAKEGEGPDALVEAGSFLRHCHIAQKDRTAPRAGGDDFTPYFKALKQIDYQGYISFECRWDNFEKDIAPSMAEVKRQIKAIYDN